MCNAIRFHMQLSQDTVYPFCEKICTLYYPQCVPSFEHCPFPCSVWALFNSDHCSALTHSLHCTVQKFKNIVSFSFFLCGHVARWEVAVHTARPLLCAGWNHWALCDTTVRCVIPLCAVWNHWALCDATVRRVIPLCTLWYHCASCDTNVRLVIPQSAVW
jgi:hypothetical protein